MLYVKEWISFSIGRSCPPNYNPADHFIQVLAICTCNEAESREAINKICDAFDRDEIAGEVKTTIKELTCSDGLPAVMNADSERYRAPWIVQIRAILWRSWISMMKEPLLIKVRFIQTLVSHISKIIGSLKGVWQGASSKFLAGDDSLLFFRWYPFWWG